MQMMSRVLKLIKIVQKEGISEAVYTTYRFVKFEKNLDLYIYWIINKFEWSIKKDINGNMMLLNFNPNEQHKIERELVRAGIREPGVTSTLRDVLIRLNSEYEEIHVFDIGANIGYYVLLEASIIDNGDIYAIEPEPSNVKRLNQNIALNHYEHVHVLPVAAGKDRGEKQLARRSSSNVHRMSEVLFDAPFEDTVEVDVYPVDQIIDEKNISNEELIVVRMDVEGYELQALEGMKKLLSSNRPIYLILEVHAPRVDMQRINELLDRYQFSPEFISMDGGETCNKIDDLKTLDDLESNGHVFASRC